MVALCVAGGCGTPSSDLSGTECNQPNILRCANDANGSPVALQCQTMSFGNIWTQVAACPSCDHVTDDQTALVCGGVNVAIGGDPCQLQDAAACDLQNITHVVTCTVGTWMLKQDCSTMNQICGYTGLNTLGCTLPKM